MIRPPAVAGQFYPSNPAVLKKLITGLCPKEPSKKEEVLGCILPHAGYVYSGSVAASVLSQITVAETYVIMGPNHTGYGPASSIMTEGEWQTPFGSVNINTLLAQKILKNSKYLEEDTLAHAYEHSIEVELPLIQAIARPEFTFVPIILASNDILVYKDIACAVAKAIQETPGRVTLIASSDMTHYETQTSANQKDEEAIRAILDLDEKELLQKIDRLNISMCGYIPAVVLILTAKKLGAKSAKLIAYQTSGDVSGDYSAVVGYAGIIIK